MGDRSSKVVTLIYKSIPHYRAPLYEEIRTRLAEEGLEFRLIYGRPSPDEVRRRDTVDVAWGHAISNHIIGLAGKELYWQPCMRLLRGSDLVIVEQASKLLLNYVLFGQQFVGGRRLALWGHGRNFQERTASRFGEAIKRTMSRHVHWWFAYNERSAEVVRTLGFPPERITVVQNSMDTRPLISKKLELRRNGAELSQLRSALELRGNNVAVYTGGLYKGKRLDFLLEAALEIRRQIPDFELLIIGAGPEEHDVEVATRKNQWIRWVGPKFDMDKVAYVMLAKVMLLPALVGLAVIDSFALEVPLVTIDSVEHGPEVDYLRNGVNGLNLPAQTGAEEYASAVASLLHNDSLQGSLREGCREAAATYTLEEMIDRFVEGILRALRH
jgi:glycosyltransferase involved in cell wall biosynthesis